jgi:hypothetical protein
LGIGNNQGKEDCGNGQNEVPNPIVQTEKMSEMKGEAGWHQQQTNGPLKMSNFGRSEGQLLAPIVGRHFNGKNALA